MRRQYSEASSLRQREWSKTGRPSESWIDRLARHLASLPQQIRHQWRRWRRPRHLPDPAISSPLARIPWFFHSLLRGSAVGCDGMDGFGDLLLSHSDPVVSLRPAHADPPPATVGVSRSGGVDRGRGLPAAAVSARVARTPHPVVSFFSRLIGEDVRTACVYVESLTKELVFTTKDVTQLLVKGLSNRRTGATSANADSSRSHCVFTCVSKSESKVVLLIILSCTFNFYLVMSFFLRS
uniref:Kinesin motor domain-containing protein n=1 Tax=Oryza barthii TaxID=65489 RepID=A0A0D3FW79_9ORYZ